MTNTLAARVQALADGFRYTIHNSVHRPGETFNVEHGCDAMEALHESKTLVADVAALEKGYEILNCLAMCNESPNRPAPTDSTLKQVLEALEYTERFLSNTGHEIDDSGSYRRITSAIALIKPMVEHG